MTNHKSSTPNNTEEIATQQNAADLDVTAITPSDLETPDDTEKAVKPARRFGGFIDGLFKPRMWRGR